ncbi:MAG: hypothetical protein CMF50_07790 [Legionellales bacterium]|nr:hypothetical protein [Legionellales bacterium]|tara:strand:- start:13574 stop:13768 length:195 start_codon:yes stop_codon:yes gene_type:complete
MVSELQDRLSAFLPLRDEEQLFIETIRADHQICPELITQDEDFAIKIATHPAIHWAMKQYQSAK